MTTGTPSTTHSPRPETDRARSPARGPDCPGFEDISGLSSRDGGTRADRRPRIRRSAKAGPTLTARRVSQLANLRHRGIVDRRALGRYRLTTLLCRGCESRRCACWRPEPRRLASAPALSLALAEQPPAPMPPSLLDGTKGSRAGGGLPRRAGDASFSSISGARSATAPATARLGKAVAATCSWANTRPLR